MRRQIARAAAAVRLLQSARGQAVLQHLCRLGQRHGGVRIDLQAARSGASSHACWCKSGADEGSCWLAGDGSAGDYRRQAYQQGQTLLFLMRPPRGAPTSGPARRECTWQSRPHPRASAPGQLPSQWPRPRLCQQPHQTQTPPCVPRLRKEIRQHVGGKSAVQSSTRGEAG